MAYIIAIKLNYYYPSDYPMGSCPLLKFRSFEIIFNLQISIFSVMFCFYYPQLTYNI